MDATMLEKILDNHEKRLIKLEREYIKTPKMKKSKHKSILDLLNEIKSEEFFSTKRTPREIMHRLSEKGHTYKRIQSLTGPLQRATKQEIIKREKAEAGWVYYA